MRSGDVGQLPPLGRASHSDVGWSYRDCTTPSEGPSAWCGQALKALRQLDPGGRSLGCYNVRRVAGAPHTWSLHACGRAIDWRPSDPARGQQLADWIAWFSGDDVQLVLYAGRQWGGRHGPGWRPYHGANHHHNHLHIESRLDVPTVPPFTTTGH